LKILLTVHQFFPEYFSGTEVLTFSTAKELLRCGHEVYVFTGYPAKRTLSDSEQFDQYEIEGIQVYRFHHAYAPIGEQKIVSEIEYNNHFVASYFASLVDKVRPDIVHYFHFSRLGAALVDVVRQRNIPAYYTPTDFWAICPTSQLLLGDGSMCGGPTQQGGNCVKHVASRTRWQHYSKIVHHLPDKAIDLVAVVAKSSTLIKFPFKQEIAALSDRKPFNVSRLNALQGIVSPTRLMTDVLTRNGVNKDLITQSAYGINVDGFDNEQRVARGGSSITFGYIGTLAPHKGCHILVAAFLALKQSTIQLKIYGNPKDFPEYVAGLVKITSGAANIEFCGTFPNSQIAEVLAGIDALVVPSVWYENTPLVVYSALAAKCPVIASNFPGMSEVIRADWNGLLFKPGDSNSLSQTLQRLLQEPTLLNELSENCMRPKSIATYVEELLTLYSCASTAPRHALLQQQMFEPFVPSKEYGVVAGWVVASLDEPKAVRIFDVQGVCGLSTRFMPRPDVRDGLKKSGLKVSKVNFGFALTITRITDCTTAYLEIEDRLGAKHQVSIANMLVGESVQSANGVTLGLDRLDFSVEEVQQI
jgi:glycosyltransferase involved in cell wall biosynthesis